MKVLISTFLLIALVANNLWAQNADSRGRSLTMTMITETVSIDGMANEAFWGQIDAVVFDTALVTSNGVIVTPDSDNDFSGNFKLAYDANNLYVLVTMKDQSIIQGVNEQSDNIELFFNVDSAQHARDGYNNLFASQIRMNVMDTTNLITGGGYAISAGDATNYKYSTQVTVDGWVVEGQIPWALIVPDTSIIPHPFIVAEGSMMEFEIQPADADDSTRLVNNSSKIRESILAWNGKNVNAWKNVDLFGNLILGAPAKQADSEDPAVSRLRSLTMGYVPSAYAVTVDGEANEEVWGKIEATVFDTAVVNTNGVIITPDNDADFSGDFKMCWDENNMYILVSMKDQAIVQGVNEQSDNIELFFNVDPSQHVRDGYNNLTASQIRMNVMNTENLITGGGYAISAGDATNWKYVTKVTDGGWVVEGQIPWALVVPDASVIPHSFTVAEGSVIEFEIEPADGDDVNRMVKDASKIRESILTWNGKNLNAWKDVDLFGKLKLGGAITGFTSVPLIEKNRVLVYPTAANSILNIRIEDATKVKSIAIVNIAGQNITEFIPAKNQSTIDVSSFKKGMYFVKVLDKKGSVTSQKFIKY